MLHQNALLVARNRELEEQLVVMTKRKSRKRKWIQQGGTIEYGTAAAQVAEASVVPQGSKKACGSSNQETARPTQRRCGNCGATGHNARTCNKDIEISSESDSSTTDLESIIDSD